MIWIQERKNGVPTGKHVRFEVGKSNDYLSEGLMVILEPGSPKKNHICKAICDQKIFPQLVFFFIQIKKYLDPDPDPFWPKNLDPGPN